MSIYVAYEPEGDRVRAFEHRNDGLAPPIVVSRIWWMAWSEFYAGTSIYGSDNSWCNRVVYLPKLRRGPRRYAARWLATSRGAQPLSELPSASGAERHDSIRRVLIVMLVLDLAMDYIL